jgi:tol-pal system protein YbgF
MPYCFKLILAFALVGLGGMSHAALFEDDEARRAILDLRQKLELANKNLEATQQTIKLQAEENGANQAAVRRGMLDLQNQIEALKSELSVMRGANEQLLRELANFQVKQKDILQGIDARLTKFEPVSVVLDGLSFQTDPAEKKEFDAALAVFRTGDFAGAQASLLNFLRRYPTSGYAASSLFWIGNSQYATKDYKEAVINFRKLLNIAPQHARAPEAMLAISNCLVELKDMKAAKKAMEELISTYPSSDAAQTAKERIAKMR